MEPASASLVSLRASTATSRSCFSCRQRATPRTRMLPAMVSKSGAKLYLLEFFYECGPPPAAPTLTNARSGALDLEQGRLEPYEAHLLDSPLVVAMAIVAGLLHRSNSCQCCIEEDAACAVQGTGRNKKNGNIFERWKCFDCQGFGMRKCPTCGKGGLTPEQRGER
ncbi:hypothetical protein TRIUR3_07870 [Triticum urartu]|uniref:Uncharacterized protein n=1 Tax=Triticum urartu TaxID=4572 RepID=M7YIF6_TRIUA|nr:hypothetical protein TRIUR3_07870 [Triticum urartu]